MACRALGGPPARRGSANWLALPLALSCGDAEPGSWSRSQDCSIGIPPEVPNAAPIAPVHVELEQTLYAPTSGGFYLRDFTIGPIGGFFCKAYVVTGHYVDESSGGFEPSGLEPSLPAPRPSLARPIELDPFECRASDGRVYTLTGEGQADPRSAFINMTFGAWLGAGQATLICTTRIQRQDGQSPAPDTGLQTPPAESEPAPEEILPDPTSPELSPDAGVADAPG